MVMFSKRCLSLHAALVLHFLIAPTPSFNAANLERKESETAIPGLSYGEVEDLPKPKTIFFGAGIDNILADAAEWKNRGIDAFFVDYVAREWSTDIWSTDGKPWTIGDSDETLQKAKAAAAICRENDQQTPAIRHLRPRGRIRWNRTRYRVHQ
jgi:hypothetical protein